MENYGRKRRVVGAHYGTFDFIAQRVTAIILGVYSVLFMIAALFSPLDWEHWKGFFTFTIFGLPVGAISASLAFIALAYHAWIGVRDIWMDYVQSVGIRLALQVITILWLISSVVYFLSVIWHIQY